MSFTESAIIELDTVDSTNNYAMSLIDADKARHGLTITARRQAAGKGQRGRTWFDVAGQSLLMSLVCVPNAPIGEQFVFNATVAAAIANELQNLYHNWNVSIKWPNDLIINDKKTGGILIENVLRGSVWAYSVIGIGLNVNQANFPPDLPYATSLKRESRQEYDIMFILNAIRDGVLTSLTRPLSMAGYNALLYRKGQRQLFGSEGRQWMATVTCVHTDGSLEVELESGAKDFYQHGKVEWVWG